MARFASLFLGVFLLLAGFGLSASLVSLTLAQRDLTSWVGWVGAAYFVGLGLGSLRGAAIVARVGVLRAYGVLSAVGCLGILMLVVVDDPLAWLLARGLQGVALGGLYVCIESWLGASVEASSRGWVLGVYQVVVYLGLGVGQLLMGALAFDLGTALVVAAMCLCLAALPVGSTRQVPPDLDDTVALGLRELWGLASVGLVGAAVSGVTTGAVYAVAPAAGVVAGLDDGQVAWFMASFIGGGLVLQMPLGKASDVLDRRLVLAATGALTAVGALLSMAMVGRPGALIAVAAFQGGWVFAIYAIALAYTFDRVPPSRALPANATLLLVFCGGSVLGSSSSSALLAMVGPVGFFSVFVVAGTVLAAVALRAASRFDPVPDALQHDAVMMPRTSPVAGELLPVEVTEERAAPVA